jgi:hypothetical protein
MQRQRKVYCVTALPSSLGEKIRKDWRRQQLISEAICKRKKALHGRDSTARLALGIGKVIAHKPCKGNGIKLNLGAQGFCLPTASRQGCLRSRYASPTS